LFFIIILLFISLNNRRGKVISNQLKFGKIYFGKLNIFEHFKTFLNILNVSKCSKMFKNVYKSPHRVTFLRGGLYVQKCLAYVNIFEHWTFLNILSERPQTFLNKLFPCGGVSPGSDMRVYEMI
jgi:hypothetical protein